jgi:hypothetical protein
MGCVAAFRFVTVQVATPVPYVTGCAVQLLMATPLSRKATVPVDSATTLLDGETVAVNVTEPFTVEALPVLLATATVLVALFTICVSVELVLPL